MRRLWTFGRLQMVIGMVAAERRSQGSGLADQDKPCQGSTPTERLCASHAGQAPQYRESPLLIWLGTGARRLQAMLSRHHRRRTRLSKCRQDLAGPLRLLMLSFRSSDELTSMESPRSEAGAALVQSFYRARAPLVCTLYQRSGRVNQTQSPIMSNKISCLSPSDNRPHGYPCGRSWMHTMALQ